MIFELIIKGFEEDKQFFYEKIEGKSLAELYSKLLLTNTRIEDQINKMNHLITDDDIPF